MRVTTIDSEFVHSGDYPQIRQTAEMLPGLVGVGAYVQRGEKKFPVKDFGEAMPWLLAELQKSMSLQRYKGLGEMNPSQLWETTMDPSVRPVASSFCICSGSTGCCRIMRPERKSQLRCGPTDFSQT